MPQFLWRLLRNLPTIAQTLIERLMIPKFLVFSTLRRLQMIAACWLAFECWSRLAEWCTEASCYWHWRRSATAHTYCMSHLPWMWLSKAINGLHAGSRYKVDQSQSRQVGCRVLLSRRIDSRRTPTCWSLVAAWSSWGALGGWGGRLFSSGPYSSRIP